MSLYQRIANPSERPVVIAEAGINHNGSIKAARELVVAAKNAGADVVKFQTHLPEFEMIRQGPTAGYVGEPLFDLLSRMVLSRAEHVELQALCAELGIVFLSTPFSREAADMLTELGVELFKIGSGEATNVPLVSHIASKGKPVIVSTGMTTFDEARLAADTVIKAGAPLVLLHCTSTYPTAPRDVRLGAMTRLKELYPAVPVGLSDHSMTIYPALGAIALGARVIEKHFTVSRSWDGPDQSSSLEPHEMAALVEGVNIVHQAIQGSDKNILPQEAEVQRMARESIVAIKDIKAGDLFGLDNVWVKRPGTGIPARHLHEVLGRRAARAIAGDALLAADDIDPKFTG